MPKCIVCHQTLTQKSAVPLNQEGRKEYACSEHVREGLMIRAIREDLSFILFDCPSYGLITKKVWPTIEQYGIEKARFYLQDNKASIRRYLRNKSFSSEWAKICYFNKMLITGLSGYHYVDDPFYNKPIDETVYQPVIPKRKRRKSLNEIIGEGHNG